MAEQSGKVSGTANPPFATQDGKAQGQGTGSSGAHNFLKDPKSHASASGGRDFTKESRPQSEANAEVVPNPQEIPAGGKILKADPGPVSQKVSGTAAGVDGGRKPFKLGR